MKNARHAEFRNFVKAEERGLGREKGVERQRVLGRCFLEQLADINLDVDLYVSLWRLFRCIDVCNALPRCVPTSLASSVSLAL